MMPEMDGVDATKLIRAQEGAKYQALPIIALTANAIVGARDMFIAAGFSDFLSKPIEVDKLSAILAKWIPEHKQTEVAAPLMTDATDLGIVIPGVDVARGLKLSGGNAENYMYTLRVFHPDGIKKLKELQETLDAGDINLYTIHAHALKAACANIGATTLSEAAGRLETAGKRGDAAEVMRDHAAFLEELTKVLTGVKEVLQDGQKSEEDYDREELAATIAALRSALDDLNLSAIKQATRTLRGYTGYAGIGESISAILHSVLVSEYDEAIVLIDEGGF
jgi:CheY-like chemotaxis protein